MTQRKKYKKYTCVEESVVDVSIVITLVILYIIIIIMARQPADTILHANAIERVDEVYTERHCNTATRCVERNRESSNKQLGLSRSVSACRLSNACNALPLLSLAGAAMLA